MHKTRIFIASCLLMATAGVFAGEQEPRAATSAQTTPAAQLPAWEDLSSEQRELLLSPIRARWNANPADRARIYQHAERWQSMTPEQRKHARRGLNHWEHMDPERRAEMKALFQAMKAMTPEQRKDLRKRWRDMTPTQRRAWVEANPPKPQ